MGCRVPCRNIAQFSFIISKKSPCSVTGSSINTCLVGDSRERGVDVAGGWRPCSARSSKSASYAFKLGSSLYLGCDGAVPCPSVQNSWLAVTELLTDMAVTSDIAWITKCLWRQRVVLNA